MEIFELALALFFQQVETIFWANKIFFFFFEKYKIFALPKTTYSSVEILDVQKIR